MGKVSRFFSAKALFENGSVTAIPIIWAFRLVNLAIESRKVHISLVQTEVKAPTKNAKTVLFPKNSPRLRGFESVSGNVKFGALSPTFIAFANLRPQVNVKLAVYKSIVFLNQRRKRMDKSYS